MTETAERLKTQLNALPREDRAELAPLLLHTLDDEAFEGDETWDAELERRLVEIRSGSTIGEPVDSVFNQLREKYA